MNFFLKLDNFSKQNHNKSNSQQLSANRIYADIFKSDNIEDQKIDLSLKGSGSDFQSSMDNLIQLMNNIKKSVIAAENKNEICTMAWLLK